MVFSIIYGYCVSEKSSINNDPGSLKHRCSFGSSFNPAFRAAGMRGKPLKTSAWETKILESEHFFFFSLTYTIEKQLFSLYFVLYIRKQDNIVL